MNLPKLTEDLDVITKLSDQPIEAGLELKQKFDEAGNKIKAYINSILTGAIERGVTNDIASMNTTLQKYVDTTINKAKASINSDVNSEINKMKNEINSTLNNKIKEINNSLNNVTNNMSVKTYTPSNIAGLTEYASVIVINKVCLLSIRMYSFECNEGNTITVCQLPVGARPRVNNKAKIHISNNGAFGNEVVGTIATDGKISFRSTISPARDCFITATFLTA